MARRYVSTVVCSSFLGTAVTLSISENGDVYSFGKHRTNAHGHSKELIPVPKRISSLCYITVISTCGFHTACVNNNGDVFTFGCNTFGQLGIGKDAKTLPRTHIPQKVNLPPIQYVTCGVHHTTCLTYNGELFSFGRNEYGELGHGNRENCYLPKKIDLGNIDFVESGDAFTFCKTFSNDVYAWGCNDKGQLGNGSVTNQFSPCKVNSCPEDVIDIKCGRNHTLVLTLNQRVYSCGDNFYFQLGRETSSSNFVMIPLFDIIRIECGKFHCLCIDVNNDLYVYGQNSYGQLGLDNNTNYSTKVTKHPSLSNIIDISNGGFHTFVKTSNNEIYAFGYNKYSQLGIGTEYEDQITPIRVFEDNEDIWFSNINKSKAKSARF